MPWCGARQTASAEPIGAGGLEPVRGDQPEYLKAIAFFDNAKQGFTEAGYTIPIPLTDQKIDLVKQRQKVRRETRLTPGLSLCLLSNPYMRMVGARHGSMEGWR